MSDEILTRMAEDIGYIKAVAKQIDQANLPHRVTKLEIQSENQRKQIHLIATSREKFVTKSFIAAATMGSVATAAAAIVALVLH